VLPSTINIGVRHILPLYPFFAIVASSTVVLLAGSSTRVLIAACLAAIALTSSVIAHPDYLPYFNSFAGSRPYEIFTDSNFDWGQDLFRVAPEMRRRHLRSLRLVYAGNANPFEAGIPGIDAVDPFRYTDGWIAISEMLYRSNGPKFRWLRPFNPVGRIGKTLRLYDLPPADTLFSGYAFGSGTGDFEPILVPLWFRGLMRGANVWTCEVVARTDAEHPVPLRTAPRADAPVAATITKSDRFVNVPLAIDDAPAGALLFLPAHDSDLVRMTVILRSGRYTIVAPVAHARDFTRGPIQFLGVPARRNLSITLRIYDATGSARTATVRTIRNGRQVERTVELSQNPSGALSAATVSIDALFPDRDEQSTIVVDALSEAGWAFLTATDLSSGAAYVVPPS
jgi:hypothetical protein